MRRPTARVGRNRRRVCLYTTAVLVGAALFLTAPIANGQYLAGLLLLLAGTGGFVLDSEPQR
ncbi:hypothetical protein [Arthrobacter silvisoli]|uniref:hypothetical protein n=1 Tax=Arthrobacter silvisoli TaxID=2291022 RepID=UPI000E21A8C3|nr:hypothetical protein [Arthrobacter silvisoli]